MLPDLDRWIDQGVKYAASSLGRVLLGLGGQLVIACGLAALTAWLVTRGSASRFRNDTIYGSVFRRYAPTGFFPWVHVVLDDGTEFWGYERAHEDREEQGSRTVVLAGNTLMRRLKGETERVLIGDDWDIVVIDSEHIRYMKVIYQNHAGERERARVRTRAQPTEPTTADHPIPVQQGLETSA